MIGRLFFMLVLAGTFTAAQANEVKPYHALCHQLVSSIKNGDLVEFASSWASSRCLVRLKSRKVPVTDELIEGARAFTTKRNEHVIHAFEVLTQLFKKHGDLKNLELIDISMEGNIEEQGNVKMIKWVYVTVKSGEAQYKIALDDVVEDEGDWYIFDFPRYVEGGPDNKRINLQIEAAKKE